MTETQSAPETEENALTEAELIEILEKLTAGLSPSQVQAQYGVSAEVVRRLAAVVRRLGSTRLEGARALRRAARAFLARVRRRVVSPCLAIPNALGRAVGLGVVPFLVAPLWAIILIPVALLIGLSRRRRRLGQAKPRLVWGPYPNYSAVEISRAMRLKGYQCDTIVYWNFSRIWKSTDFTFVLGDFLSGFLPWWTQKVVEACLAQYIVFLRVLRRYEIVHGTFYYGYLQSTPLRRLEPWLIHLAGMKQVNVSVGGEVYLSTDVNSVAIRQGFNDFYPHVAQNHEQDLNRRRIRFWSRHSDCILCQSSYMLDCLPRWDVLVTQYFPIDTDGWKGSEPTDRDGRNGIVRIGHSPNHRPLKGTNFLIKAVQDLRREGLRIELVLLENHQNSDVRDLLADVDIVVADVMLQGYSIMAVEGLSLGKPVVQDISDDHLNRVFKLYTGLDEAPFVSATLETLTDRLRELVSNPDLRKRIGQRSRDYAIKYHSYEANSKFWIWLYEWLWHGRRDRVAFYHPDWPISTVRSLNSVVLTPRQLELKRAALANLGVTRPWLDSGRLGFFPLNARTAETLESLYLSGVMHSDDYVVVDEGDRPMDVARHWPQAVIRLSELAAYNVKALYLLECEADVEESLVAQAACVSVNDLAVLRYPSPGQEVRKPYRRLDMTYMDTVVPPLHFSNYAYINYLRSKVRPGMRVIDGFAGPGTVGLAVAQEAALKEIHFFEANPDAAEALRANARRNLADTVQAGVYLGDLFENVPADLTFDLIVGNPPHNLDLEGANKDLDALVYIQSHDPSMETHRRFLQQAWRYLKDQGQICLLENGTDGCIKPEHLEALCGESGRWQVLECVPFTGSPFYAITIVKAAPARSKLRNDQSDV